MGSKRINTVITQNGFNLVLRQLMRRECLNSRQLAELVGVSDQGVSRWKRGENLPTDKNLKRIADSLNEPYEELLKMARTPAQKPQHKPRLQEYITLLDTYGERLEDEDLEILIMMVKTKIKGKRRKR